MSYTEQFELVAPYYMAMGMPLEEFWNGDCESVRLYRKCFNIKQENKADEMNMMAYMTGMYFYEALCDVSPILRAFSKATQPLPYPSEPYDLHKAEKEAEERKRKEEEDKAMLKAKTMMELFMMQNNKKFKKTPGKEVSDGRSNN